MSPNIRAEAIAAMIDPQSPRPARPTCLSCPHWYVSTPESPFVQDLSAETLATLLRLRPSVPPDVASIEGECRFGPPRDRRDKPTGETLEHPVTPPWHSCGQHPDFTAFAVALKEWCERPDFVELELRSQNYQA